MAEALVIVAAVYALLGVLFAVPFVLKGAGRIDAAAEDGSIGFRVLIFPGAVAFWPLLLRRWLGMRNAGEPT